MEKRTLLMFLAFFLISIAVINFTYAELDCKGVTSITIVSRPGLIDSERVMQLMDRNHLEYECVKQILGLSGYEFYLELVDFKNERIVLDDTIITYGIFPGKQEAVYGLRKEGDFQFEKNITYLGEFTAQNLEIGQQVGDFTVCELVPSGRNFYSISFCLDFSEEKYRKANISLFHGNEIRDWEFGTSNCTFPIDENEISPTANLVIDDISETYMKFSISPRSPVVIPPTDYNLVLEVEEFVQIPQDFSSTIPDFFKVRNSVHFERFVLMETDGAFQFVRLVLGIWK